MRVITLDAHEQSWPLDKPFRTARGASTAARVVVVTVSDGQDTGRGEAAPITRYKQSVASVLAQIESIASVPALPGVEVDLIEQPFPADADEVLETLDHPVPVCADESCHTSADLPRLTNRYEMLNVKLDKTGGLTEALLLTERARDAGFKLLMGCMVCTSLGIAPARLVASLTDYVDLDGPLLLAGDRHHRLPYENGRIGAP